MPYSSTELGKREGGLWSFSLSSNQGHVVRRGEETDQYNGKLLPLLFLLKTAFVCFAVNVPSFFPSAPSIMSFCDKRSRVLRAWLGVP